MRKQADAALALSVQNDDTHRRGQHVQHAEEHELWMLSLDVLEGAIATKDIVPSLYKPGKQKASYRA
jgi:hypothetical protein